MKQKMSVSIEGKTIKKVEDKLKEGLFRSKSHIVEYSLNKFLEESKCQ